MSREAAAMKFNSEKTLLGFWIYLMTDIVLFATLFATFIILRDNTFGGPDGQELFKLDYVLLETMVLLASSFTAGLGLLAAFSGGKQSVVAWFGITFILGSIFLGLEVYEFAELVHHGHGWTASAFLSAFFTLVGTHGLHISAGLVWMGALIWQVFKTGLNQPVKRRLAMLSLFWHFLDIIWIFIFSVVFLLGVIDG